MKKKLVYTSVFVVFIFIITFFLVSGKTNPQKEILKFSSWGSQSETAVLNSVIKEYEEKNPNIKIDFIHIPQDYFRKIRLLFASNTEPDVIFFNNQNIKIYIKSGLLEDLTPYFDENVFFKEAVDCFKYEDKLYAIPRDISNLVIYYNKDILKKHNITDLTEIKDIYELKSLAEKLTTPDYFGINSEEDSLYWLYYLASNGGGAVSDDLKKIIIGEDKSIEALNLYSDFINKYHIAPSKSQIGSMTTAQMFINGKLAMYLGGRWLVPKFRETIDFDWDIIQFPAGKENKVYIDASGWAVAKNSKNKKAAIELVKYLSCEKTINQFAESGLIIPARKDSAFSNHFLDGKKPKNAEIFINMIENAKPSPVNENSSAINDILNEQAQSILESGKSPEEAFNKKTIKQLEKMLN